MSPIDNIVTEVVQRLLTATRIIFVTGAGVSTNHGLPDFRSNNGLFSQNIEFVLMKIAAPSLTAEDTYQENVTKNIETSILRQKCKTLFEYSALHSEGTALAHSRFSGLLYKYTSTLESKPQSVHALMAQVHQQGRLQRCYTQNIDGLEERYGLATDMRVAAKKGLRPPENMISDFQVVQLHGDIGSARCIDYSCIELVTPQIYDHFYHASNALCKRCLKQSSDRKAAGKRLTTSQSKGRLRPNIVLYNEVHPFSEYISTVNKEDILSGPDLLVIIGTSLAIHRLREMIECFAKEVHINRGKVVYINRSQPTRGEWCKSFDYNLNMDCDVWAEIVLKAMEERSGGTRSRSWAPTSVNYGSEHELSDQDFLDVYFNDDSE